MMTCFFFFLEGCTIFKYIYTYNILYYIYYMCYIIYIMYIYSWFNKLYMWIISLLFSLISCILQEHNPPNLSFGKKLPLMKYYSSNTLRKSLVWILTEHVVASLMVISFAKEITHTKTFPRVVLRLTKYIWWLIHLLLPWNLVKKWSGFCQLNRELVVIDNCFTVSSTSSLSLWEVWIWERRPELIRSW